jgi:hypothetical protein
MAGDGISVTVRGLDDISRELRALPAKLRKRAIMNSLRAGARIIRDEIRRGTPVLSVPIFRKGRLIRKPGTVRQNVTVRTSRLSARSGNLGVFVNVRPAKGANRGINNPFDPFYWRFLVGMTGKFRAAIRAGGARLPQALAKIEATLGPQIQKLNRKGAQP